MRASTFITVCGVALLAASGAWAQATRTWISGVGDDVNPCSRTAPCKTFPGAIAKTAAGGEIDTLDPGGFGGVTVTKAITLADEGVGEGGILVAGTNGITINCSTDPNCVVIVRGLVLDGGPVGSNSLSGIHFISGKTLIVQNTTFRNFTGGSPNGYGVYFSPSASQSENLVIENSSFATNGVFGSSGAGVFIAPTGAAVVNAVIDHVQINGNNAGLRIDTTGSTAGGSVNASLSNSVVSSNSGAGVGLTAGTGIPTVLTIDHSTISQNNVGLNANGASAILRIGSSTVTGNAIGVKNQNSATMSTFGNNQIADNPTPGPALSTTPGPS